MTCRCKCKEQKYIVLQDFWLRDIKLLKGQVIGDPVSKRWITLRLISPYDPEDENRKKEVERIASEMHIDNPVPVQNEVETSEITVPKKSEKTKRRGGRRKKSTVIVETPEKSEILLQKMIESEVDNL